MIAAGDYAADPSAEADPRVVTIEKNSSPSPLRSRKRYVSETFGVDKVVWRFIAHELLDRGHPWRPDRDNPRHAFKALRGNGNVTLTAKPHPLMPGCFWVTVECNPARYVDPHGYRLCALDDVREVATVLLERALPHVRSRQEPSLCRLDVAMDFTGVDSPEAMLTALGAAPRPWGKRHFRWSDLSDLDPNHPLAGSVNLGSMYLHAGKDAGLVRVYDKAKETRDTAKATLAPPGTLRAEIQAEQRWLRASRIRGTEHLAAERLHRVWQRRWDWSGIGADVLGRDVAEAYLLAKGHRRDVVERDLEAMTTFGMAKTPTERTRDLAVFKRTGSVLVPPSLTGLPADFAARLDPETRSLVHLPLPTTPERTFREGRDVRPRTQPCEDPRQRRTRTLDPLA